MLLLKESIEFLFIAQKENKTKMFEILRLANKTRKSFAEIKK